MLGKTTGARIAGILLTYAAIAVLLSVAAYLACRPISEAQIRESITQDAASIGPLQARLSAEAFTTLIAERSLADSSRGVEYSLRAPAGTILAGRLPDVVWRFKPRAGYVRFDLPPAGDVAGPTRHMLGRAIAFADGTQLLVGYDVDARVAAASRLLWPVTLATVLTALAGVAAALVFARRGEMQLREASAVVGRILAGDLSRRMRVGAGTGLSALADELNVALERIEQLTVAMRAVADSTAHDLRAPLNRLRAALEYALVGDADAPSLRASIERALGEVERVETTLEALLRIALAEAGTVSLAPVDLSALVADVVDLYSPLAEQKGLLLASRLAPGLSLNANAQLLAQAVANLIDNAIKYTPRTGRIEVLTARAGGALSLTVADTGPGIAAEDRARALERSQRLANAAGTQGSGLGLALVVAVMRLHGGAIELADHGPGLRVQLTLPVG